MIHIAETFRGERVGIDAEMAGRNRVRCREYRPGATYILEFAKAFPGSGTGGIETIESLRWIKRGVLVRK